MDGVGGGVTWDWPFRTDVVTDAGHGGGGRWEHGRAPNRHAFFANAAPQPPSIPASQPQLLAH